MQVSHICGLRFKSHWSQHRRKSRLIPSSPSGGTTHHTSQLGWQLVSQGLAYKAHAECSGICNIPRHISGIHLAVIFLSMFRKSCLLCVHLLCYCHVFICVLSIESITNISGQIYSGIMSIVYWSSKEILYTRFWSKLTWQSCIPNVSVWSHKW